MSRVRVELHAEVERWPLAQPFRISGYTFHAIDVLVVTLSSRDASGVRKQPASIIETTCPR